MVLFRDREDAGRQLGAALKPLNIERPIVLGIPRGGVPVAAEVSRMLGGELGVVVARKLRSPWQPELAIGAITSDGVAFINEDLARDTGADDRYLAEEQAYQAAEALRREEAFDSHRRPPVAGRNVVIIDDGIATGATAIAALRSMKAAGAARVILAVPVGPRDTIATMRLEADDVVCPSVESEFFAIGQFYIDFRQMEDAEVKAILDAFTVEQTETRRDFFVTRDSVRLAGRFAAPAGPGPWPCVIFVHGLGSDKDSPRNVVVAENLLDHGFATILFDLSGHGESTATGDGMQEYVKDLAAIYDWARQQPQVDSWRIGIAGSSLGGVVALHALRAGFIQPTTLVLRAPPVEPGEFEGLSLPSLALIGSEDPLLPALRAAAQDRPSITLSVVPGAGHLFDEPGALDAALERTLTWFESALTTTQQTPVSA